MLDYTLDSAYAEYLVETMKQQDEMERCINEALIISSGDNVNARLTSVNEAVTGKVKEVWEKFVAFIKRVFGKFMENLTKILDTDAGYLAKYEKIIKNKPFKLNVAYKDYRLDRIAAVQIPLFNYSTLRASLESKSKFMHSVISDFRDSDSADDLSGWCKAYFCNDKEEEVAVQNINMTDLYNYCYDFKTKTIPNLERDQKNINQSSANANSLIINAIRTQENQQKQVQNTAPTNTTSTPNNTAPQTNTNTQQQTQHNSADLFGSSNPYSKLLNRVLGEAKIEAVDNGSGTAANTATNSPNGQRFSANASNATGQPETKDTAASAVTSNGDLTEDKVNEIVSIYSSVAQSIFTAKLTIAHSAYKDFMQVIRAHVKMYVGDDDAINQTAKGATNYNQNGDQANDKPQPTPTKK